MTKVLSECFYYEYLYIYILSISALPDVCQLKWHFVWIFALVCDVYNLIYICISVNINAMILVKAMK